MHLCYLPRTGVVQKPLDIYSRIFPELVQMYPQPDSCSPACHLKYEKSRPGCSKCRSLNELVKGHFVNCFSGFNT